MKRLYFHRLVLVILALLICCQLCACDNPESTATIVGYWQGDFRFDDYNFYHSWEMGDELHIYEDGTFRIDGENGKNDGKYELLYDGQAITFNFGDCAYGPYDITLESSNTLIIATNEDTFYLDRVS